MGTFRAPYVNTQSRKHDGTQTQISACQTGRPDQEDAAPSDNRKSADRAAGLSHNWSFPWKEPGDSGGHRHGQANSAGPSSPRTCGDFPRGVLFPTSDHSCSCFCFLHHLLHLSIEIRPFPGGTQDTKDQLVARQTFLYSTALFMIGRSNPLKSNILIEGLESLRVRW